MTRAPLDNLVPRTVRLLPELDAKLVRYAELRNIRPEEVVAAAIESHVRFVVDQAFRLADAIAAHQKAHPLQHD